MRTLSISITDLELDKFGINKDEITFSEFVSLVSKELTKQTHIKCLELSEKFGLSKMTMEAITKEVNAVRKNAKARH